jgi:hypothetical protein
VHLGQLSSAILEYETILQRDPADKDALAAMADIENKAKSLTDIPGPIDDIKRISSGHTEHLKKQAGKTETNGAIDDGRQLMHKIFVDSKIITAGDFEMCWTTPSLNGTPEKISDPFVQVLVEKGMVQIEKALRIVLDKSRLGYLSLDKYDVDMELARSFPRDVCQRWCVLPFDKMSKSVFIATTNPFNKQAAKEIQAATSLRAVWYIAPPMDIVKVLRRVFR